MTFLWLLVRALCSRDASEAAAAALAVLPRASAKSPIDLDGGDGNETAFMWTVRRLASTANVAEILAEILKEVNR